MSKFLQLPRPWLFLVPVLVGIVVLVLAVKTKSPPEKRPPQETTTSVRTIKVPEVTLIPRAIGYGSITPGRVWEAVAEVAGKVVEIHPQLKKGAIISKGEVLLRIDPTDYRLAITQAEADIRAVESQIDELNAREKNTQASLKIEKRSLELTLLDFDRKQKLLARGNVSQAAVDQEERNVLQGRQSVQSLQNTLNLLPAEREVLIAQKAQHQAQLEAAKLDLERTEITAPFDCRIAEVNVQATQYTGLGKVLAIADDIGVSEVTAQVPIGSLLKLVSPDAEVPDNVGSLMTRLPEMLGFEAVVRLRASTISAEWQARFTRINDAIDPETRTAGVIVAVDNPYRQAVPGTKPPLTKNMFVEVELKGRARPNQIVVPRSSLHGSELYVVNEESRLEVRKVDIAFTQTDFAVIKGNLKAGETIIVSDPIPAISGMLVKPFEDASALETLVQAAEGGGSIR